MMNEDEYVDIEVIDNNNTNDTNNLHDLHVESDINSNDNNDEGDFKETKSYKTQSVFEEKDKIDNIIMHDSDNEEQIGNINLKEKNKIKQRFDTTEAEKNIELKDFSITTTEEETEIPEFEGPSNYKTNDYDKSKLPRINDPNLKQYHWLTVYMIIFVMGIAFLLPYNAFITAEDYYKVLFGDKIEYQITVSYTSSIMISMVLILVLRSKDKRRIGILVSYSFFFVVLIILPFFYYFVIGTDVNSISSTNLEIAFWVTMVTVFAIALMEGLIQASLYGLVAYFDGCHDLLKSRLSTEDAEKLGGGRGLYTQSLVIGCSTSAIIASANRIISKYYFEHYASSENEFQSLQEGTFIFFFVCAVIVFSSIVFFIILQKFPFAQKYLWDKDSTFTRSIAKYEVRNEEEMEEYISELTIEKDLKISTSDNVEIEKEISEPNNEIIVQQSIYQKILYSTMVQTLIDIKVHVLCLFFNFLFTLMIFPGIVVQIPSEKYGDWFQVFLVAVSAICDFSGRALGLVKFFTRIPSKYFIFVLLFRVSMIPLFFLCIEPYIFKSEIYPTVFLAIFILTHGALASLIPMRAIRLSEDKDMIGRLLVFALLLGLNVGSVCGYLIDIAYFDYIIPNYLS